MTIKFILIFVYVVSGDIAVELEGFANGMDCNEAAMAEIEEKRLAGNFVISVDCVPVSKSWGLKT